jgi:glycosyltransferase involved in cell wall biosynthesis
MLRKIQHLEGKFVAAYIGTHGMAHQLDLILEAADRLRARPDIAFLLIGDGADRERLVARCRSMALPNVVMLPQVPREAIANFWAASDAAIVTLRAAPLFELVIPSKMFEAMAMRKPIILGVGGTAQRIIEDGKCGVVFKPGDAVGLADCVLKLAGDPTLCLRLGENGHRLAATTYDREVLAQQYLDVLKRIVPSKPAT